MTCFVAACFGDASASGPQTALLLLHVNVTALYPCQAGQPFQKLTACSGCTPSSALVCKQPYSKLGGAQCMEAGTALASEQPHSICWDGE